MKKPQAPTPRSRAAENVALVPAVVQEIMAALGRSSLPLNAVVVISACVEIVGQMAEAEQLRQPVVMLLRECADALEMSAPIAL